ncbi:TnsA-like heteromeric transposase endonuclease subunit [Streptomyces sp. NPDC056373]|uniref:TnsA-like heteromeric transposase endonuclease subunit n=1 Tax=Streptomyces sp. NPDC056373 TaxID=3345798 RepID=UPI0035E1BD51
MDFDPGVVGIASQPFWLHWHDGERERRHAPDYFVRRADGSAVVVDVRADDRIEPRDAEAFEVTRLACRQAGWGFERVGVPEEARTTQTELFADDPNLPVFIYTPQRPQHPGPGSAPPGLPASRPPRPGHHATASPRSRPELWRLRQRPHQEHPDLGE